MTDIAVARRNVTVEETQYRASLSEATFNKFGGAVNFINKRQNDKHSWNLNGSYKLGEGSTGTDGVFPCLFDMAITGFAYYNNVTGTSGSTVIDIHYMEADGTDNGSVFSTLPSVDDTASDNTTTIYDVINSNTVANPTGHTLGVMDTTTFTAGQVLRLDLDSAMSDANTFQFVIYFRPI